MSVVLIDTNLLLLLVVGWADPRYIASHKRLRDYGTDDFELVDRIVSGFDEIITCPNVLTEVGSFAPRIEEPARSHVVYAMRRFVEATTELVIPSIAGVMRPQFLYLGLTDSVLLHVQVAFPRLASTLLTADERLAAEASALGQNVINYPERLRTGISGPS